MLDESDDMRDHRDHDHCDTVMRIARRNPSERCDTADAVPTEFFATPGDERSAVSESVPPTSLERAPADVGAGTGNLRTFVTTVVATTEITPILRRITFGGGLDDFVSLGADQFVYVLLPPRGRSELTIGTDFTWEAARAMAESEQPTGAYYTVRSWRPDVGEIDAWFVLHGDAGDASAWATSAEPGDTAALWGPRTAFEPPPPTGSYLLVVDETGYAAAAAILDAVLATSPTTPVTVLAECDTSPVTDLLAAGGNVEVRCCRRYGAEPGTSSVLLDAVRSIDVSGDVYAYGAAESKRITEMRRHLRDVCGLTSEQVSMTGSWRR